MSGDLRSLTLLFLKLGLTAFGGPAAHIARMEDEVVRRRGWMDRETFLDLVGTCSLLPGPNSTELALHLGLLRGGWRGLLLAGICFILPAALITLALAWVYVRYGALPQMGGLLAGIKPVVLAVVLQAVWNLGRTALRTPTQVVLGVGALALSVAGIQEAFLILGAGALGVLARRRSGAAALALGLPAALPAALPVVPYSLGGLFGVFLKAGATLFGSGYVLVAYLRTDLVHRLGWITEAQLLDAVAVGQVTPGPVFTTATFVGYLVGGTSGATAATVGIFLPAFLLVGAAGWFVPRIRRHPGLGAFMDGVNAAAVALMATALWDLGRASLGNPLGLVLAPLSFLALVRWRVDATWLILGGALLGVAVSLAGA